MTTIILGQCLFIYGMAFAIAMGIAALIHGVCWLTSRFDRLAAKP